MEILNYKQLHNATEKSVTLQMVLEGKIDLVSRGLSKVTFEKVFKKQISKDVAELLGGRYATRDVVIKHLNSKASSDIYQENLSEIVLKREGDKYFWRLSTRGDHSSVRQVIRDYFNRL